MKHPQVITGSTIKPQQRLLVGASVFAWVFLVARDTYACEKIWNYYKMELNRFGKRQECEVNRLVEEFRYREKGRRCSTAQARYTDFYHSSRLR